MTITATTALPDAPNLVRFNKLVPYQSQHSERGIPRELMESLTANKVFPVVSPPGLVGRNALAPFRGWPGLCITIAECTPQQGPASHNHTGTLETFFCLDGKFDVLWGNSLENKVTLEPGDLCSVPPNVYRTFRNLTSERARLLVLIQGDEKMSDKIEMPSSIGRDVLATYGEAVLQKLAAINMRFHGQDGDVVTMAEMQARISRLHDLRASEWAGEQVYPVMAQVAGAAPVQAWPGLDVSLLQLGVGSESETTLPDDRCQWVVNSGPGACEVVVDSETTTLQQFDMLRVDPMSARRVRNVSDSNLTVLLATQTRETIKAAT